MPKKEKNSRAQKRQTWIWIGSTAIFLLVVVGIIFGIRSSQNALPLEISVVEAHKKYQEGTFLLDVRTQEQWDEYHILDATLIPLEELPYRINEIPTDQEIIVICNMGKRSADGRDILLEAGFKQVTASMGGIMAWSLAGYPLEAQP